MIRAHSLAVLVLSCDAYSDLWDGFFYQFWKNWSSCPYPIYLGSNTIKYTKNRRITTILSGPDKDWSTSCRKILEQIPETNVLVFTEDMYLGSAIDTKIVKECNRLLTGHQTYFIHWAPTLWEYFFPKNNGLFGIYEKGEPCIRINGFWNKSAYLQLLVDGQSPWKFEERYSDDVPFNQNCYYLRKPLFSLIHLTEKGRLLKSGLLYLKKNNIPLPKKTRQIKKRKSFIQRVLSVYHILRALLPWKIRRVLMRNMSLRK